MKDTILAADLFCGAGGTSQGLLMAANELNADLELVAINHWSVAIDTHSVNHPYARHLCTGLDSVDPRKLIPGGRLRVMCASPECTHHSVARGGKPMSDQSRSSAWHILRFAEALYIDSLVIENVKEFRSWGPLGANGRPMKSKRGELFAQFIGSLKALGYNVDWRILNCADYGDPTTRERLFIIARRGGKQVTWPKPTHVPPVTFEGLKLFGEKRKPWRTAREIIDWSIPSKSIFTRKKPLAEKTLRRIESGLRKFCGMDVDLRKCMVEDLRPFLVILRGTSTTADLDTPLATVTASGKHYALVEPFTVLLRKGQGARDVDTPLATLVTKENRALVTPYLITVNHGEGDQTRRAQSIDEPMRTVTQKIGEGVCEPFLVSYYGTDNMSAADEPVPTVTTRDRFAVVEARRCLPGEDLSAPVPAETCMLDIRFRMLSPRELARAQGFPDSYEFSGNREAVVKQIGNAVPPNTARALLMEVLG